MPRAVCASLGACSRLLLQLERHLFRADQPWLEWQIVGAFSECMHWVEDFASYEWTRSIRVAGDREFWASCYNDYIFCFIVWMNMKKKSFENENYYSFVETFGSSALALAVAWGLVSSLNNPFKKKTHIQNSINRSLNSFRSFSNFFPSKSKRAE